MEFNTVDSVEETFFQRWPMWKFSMHGAQLKDMWTHHKQQASVWDEPKLWSECSDYIHIGGNKDMNVAHDFQDIWCLAPFSGKVIVNFSTPICIMFNQLSHLFICLQSFNQSPLSHPMNHQEETSVHLVEYPSLRLKCKFLINVWLLPNPSVISLVQDTIGPQATASSPLNLPIVEQNSSMVIKCSIQITFHMALDVNVLGCQPQWLNLKKPWQIPNPHLPRIYITYTISIFY